MSKPFTDPAFVEATARHARYVTLLLDGFPDTTVAKAFFDEHVDENDPVEVAAWVGASAMVGLLAAVAISTGADPADYWRQYCLARAARSTS